MTRPSPTGRAAKKLGKRRVAVLRGFEVCTVNAFGVRDLNEADEEFTNFATHHDFPDLIPEREIWVDERLFENEGLFYLVNALTQLHEKEKGASDDRGYELGLEAERGLRERWVGVKYRDGRPHKRVPDRVYLRLYATLPDVRRPAKVWLIDGNLVRSYYRTEYTEGGHGYVYRWVPKGEVWVEHDLDPAELPYIVAHEYLELRLMRDEGLEYAHADAICSKVEYEIREGGEVRPLVAAKGRAFSHADLPRLTSAEFFEDVVGRHVRGKGASGRG